MKSNIIITGASKGIGKAVAEKFAADGDSLWVCARNEKDLRALSDQIGSTHPSSAINYLVCDVAKKSEVLKFAAWVKKEAGGVDILVNNAGSFNPGEIKDEDEGVLETLIETNLYSAYYLTRALLPLMISKKSGHIFNICSIASLQAYNNGGSYSITKHALAGFSANLRHELREENIKVTSVFPGAVNTASWEGSGVAAERLMDADDIAKMIHAASKLSPRACVEEIVIRPQLGDI